MDYIKDPHNLLDENNVRFAFRNIYRHLHIDNADSDLLAEELEMFVRMVNLHRKQRGYANDFSRCLLIFNDQLDTEPIESAQLPSLFPLCPKSFTPFPRLPPELRKKIWGLCAPEHGRVIELNMSEDYIFPTKHPAHAVFHVNRESRNQLLSDMGYETLMLKNNRHSRIEAWSRDAIINFTHEVLFLNPPRPENVHYLTDDIPNMLLALKQAMKQDQLERIKTLAISIKSAWEIREKVTCHLPAFRGLETLILVLEKESGDKKEIVLSRINGHTSLYDAGLWKTSCFLLEVVRKRFYRTQRESYTSWNPPEPVICLKQTRDWNQERFIPEFTWKKVPLKEVPWKHQH
ncbi:hypothetical protein BOTCAL_0022g00350 [Botryotinia calthae]|uniref:2EXR domain-containing protein n=1 Tax=Botryotinia calthae TaxID=38488 RepID=A0A4Y8DGU6_9HELO|nr:hypothetical protein BOTCAL_0022g00350 [Botryotinia calthae]